MYNYLQVALDVRSMLRRAYLNHDRLIEYQEERLRQVVRNAYDHVHFYREKFSQLGLKPGDIKNVSDLNKLPLVRRDELQKKGNDVVSDEYEIERLRVHSTSGSSGKPLCTFLTQREDEIRKAKLLRPHIVCGQRLRDKWVIIEPPQQSAKVGRLQRMLRAYAPVFVSVFDDAAKQVSAIEHLEPDVLDGYSSSLSLVASEVQRQGLDTVRPRLMMTGAELLDDPSRKLIEKVFRAPLYDQYGSEELSLIAWQCRVKGEYHIDADSLIVQFVDKNGEEVSPGEEGEIVCTSLFNYAMPFIRYAINDIGVAPEAKECECGRIFPLMKMIKGRKDSVVSLPDGRKVPALAFGWMMEFYRFYGDIAQYRIIQKKIDLLQILIKKKDGGADWKLMEAELLDHLRKTLRIREADVTIEIELVNEIPLEPTGKLRKVISEI